MRTFLTLLGVCRATGQAAGVYAALLSRAADLSPAAVRRELLQQGAFIDREQAGQPIKPMVLPHQAENVVKTAPGI